MADRKDISDDLIDILLANYEKPNDLLGKNGILEQLTKRVVERALQAELTHHLGHEKHGRVGNATGNTRNGASRKTLKGNTGELTVAIPRDRDGSFEPQLVEKYQTHWQGFDDQIISLYARGMSVREIQGHLKELYHTDVSPALISAVTDAVSEEVRQWQGRPLDAVYPILYLDCLHVKVRDSGSVSTKAVYLALGVSMSGVKELLGMWISPNEGAKFWLSVMTELRNRGVQDIFIACVDGLKGFPEAIETVFPQTQIQLCLIHLLRNSLKYVSWKERKEVAADLREVYTATTVELAESALARVEEKWDSRYPLVAKPWRSNWERVIPFFQYPPEIRKVIYTTNAIESLNMSLRKIIKTKGGFPHDEAVFKILWLALRSISKKWTMPIKDWKSALNRFAIMHGERLAC
ncbi:MAG: IS256 family transposase [Desulfovibrio sp.]|jgi:putative transposase|nr:IS256 family transposase [Desulfovibrio sp.]